MDSQFILLLIPFILLQIILQVIALINLRKKSKTLYLDKTIWIFIILLGGFIGATFYLVLEGKEHREHD